MGHIGHVQSTHIEFLSSLTTLPDPQFDIANRYVHPKTGPSRAREKHILGDSIHPLARQYQANLQELLRDVRLLFLHLRPRSLVKEPRDTVPFRSRGAGALSPREERKLAACRSLDD